MASPDGFDSDGSTAERAGLGTRAGVTRRTAIRAMAGGAAATAATAATPGAVAQDGGPDYGGWFDDVSNFDGTVDQTGQDSVTVAVGAEGNDGAFAFEPAAVAVSPGTTVQWEWTGQGGGHNVVSPEDGPLDSETYSESGVNYEQTFEEEGTFRYVCVPHESLGMKGAVVVSEESVGSAPAEGGGEAGGSGGGGGGGQASETVVGLLAAAGLAAFLSPLAFALFLRNRARREGRSGR
ncbi:halocyanin domain-containing protein [Halomicrobium salinisoli]|uniref:halocyanin domain-containing protein n=1 Tax=Halomicrobium salinisoli TaxID=2878391 RepID=UPI003B8A88E2